MGIYANRLLGHYQQQHQVGTQDGLKDCMAHAKHRENKKGLHALRMGKSIISSKRCWPEKV
jgi:hypothetical protein